jgi:hypothetical protein
MESLRNWPKEFVDLRGSWLPPAGRCPAVPEWHGARGTSSGKFGPREIVNHRRNWLQPAGRLLTVHKWNSAGDTNTRDMTSTMWYTGSRGTLGRGWRQYTWTDWHLIRELLRTSNLKERLETDHCGGTEPEESDVSSRNLRRKGRWCTDRLFGTKSLKEREM